MSVRDERVADLFLLDQAGEGEPNEEGLIRFTGTDIRAFVNGAAVSLISGTGINAAQHRTLLQLIHFIDEGPAEGFVSGATKTVTGGLFPTKVEWKRQDATLLVEKTITRSGGGATTVAPTPIVWKIYDVDGTTVLATVSDAITYSGVAEVSRVRTIS